MELNYSKLKSLSDQYGGAFYLLDVCQFKKNFKELEAELKAFYPKTHIAYSYKTNYIPALCKAVNELGGYAEVVSEMECEIARRVGVDPKRVIFNGPYKDFEAEINLIEQGAIVNIDNVDEMERVISYARTREDRRFGISLRCNYDVRDGVVSRFGFDVDSSEFSSVLETVKNQPNLSLIGLHSHFASRSVDVWRQKVEGMLTLIKKTGVDCRYVDVGGGIYGKMADSLKTQFSDYIPEYKAYAAVIAKPFSDFYADMPQDKIPDLFIEPGSALVGDVMKFVAPVVNVKKVRGKSIATVLGSIYNINPTLNKKNPPLCVCGGNYKREEVKDLDFGGFTCIESDYLYRHYDGKIGTGDFAVFGNAGSYSVVLKPPFILPNFAILTWDENDNVSVVKRRENFDDLFRTFEF